MRPLVIALSCTTVAFAASTLYLARELAAERARPEVGSLPVATNAPAAGPVMSAPAPPVAGGPAETKPAPQTKFLDESLTPRMPSEAEIKAMRANWSRKLMAQLATPEGREEFIAEHKMHARNSYPELDRVLGLDAKERARFFELMALQQLESQEAGARCALDPACDFQQNMSQQSQNRAEAREREIAELLGPERQQKFDTYKNTMGERQAVTQLSARLEGNQALSRDKAEALMVALAEERNAIYQDAAQRGGGVNSFGIGAGTVFSYADSADFEQSFETARQNSQRLRERAAQYLDAGQMRVFDEMQDEVLLSLRGQLRKRDAQGGATESVTIVN